MYVSDLEKTTKELEIRKIREEIFESVRRSNSNFEKIISELSDEKIVELNKEMDCFWRNGKRSSKTNANMFILLLYKLFDDNDKAKILAFFEDRKYGWNDDKYVLNNHCLRRSGTKDHCKQVFKISDVDYAADILADVYDIFFDKEYGKYTLYIFCYCIASLFSKKLDQDKLCIPFFLQIECDKNSVLYRLIQEIVEICDVNSGIFEKCNDLYHKYGYCGYIHKVFYPTHSTAKDVEDLINNNKDIPVLVDGNENERGFNALLREIANIPNKQKPLDECDRFNTLPIFVCSVIKSNFNNIFDMSLTDFDVSNEYLELLRSCKQPFASWVLELVRDYKSYLFPNQYEPENSEKHPFHKKIGAYINYIRQKYPDLTLENAKNVGFLNFFFKGFLQVLQQTFTFSYKESNKLKPQDAEKYIIKLEEESEKALVQLHRHYLPAPKSIGINDREAIKLARIIEKHYKALKVHTRITPCIIKEDRFVFNVDTLQQSKDTDIFRNADTVQRRLKKYECFRIDLNDPKTIKLLVAEKPLTDNSLIKILEHKDFMNSKMKIPYAVGYDEMGNMCIEDIKEFPHLLLGGATTSGKSTAMISLLTSIAYKHRSGEVQVLIIDLLGKSKSDFDIFNGQPMLSHPVIKDVETGVTALLSLSKSIEERKNLKDIPYLVCVIDEFPKLFSDAEAEYRNKLETAMTHLLSRGRHAKIHMVLAAQNPVKKHIVCDIANLNAKIALRCSHYQHSVAILGRAGADKLLGRGRMIFDYFDKTDRRLYGSYISEPDLKALLAEIKGTFKQDKNYQFSTQESEINKMFLEIETNAKPSEESKPKFEPPTFNEKLARIIILSMLEGKISNDSVKKHLKTGYDKANKIMDKLEELNIISELGEGRGSRKINPIEKIKTAQVRGILSNARDYLIKEGYLEHEIASVLDRLNV